MVAERFNIDPQVTKVACGFLFWEYVMTKKRMKDCTHEELEKKPLTMKQYHFCRILIDTNNLMLSYRQAYEAENMSYHAVASAAYKLHSLPNVKKTIKELREKKKTERELDLQYLRERHAELMEDARLNGDLSNATRNLECIGKTIGAYTDKMQIEDVSKLTEEELNEQIGVLAEEVTTEEASRRKKDQIETE